MGVRRGRRSDPAIVVNGAIAQHLEVLRGVSGRGVGVRLVERIGHVTPRSIFEMLGNRAIYHDGWMASTTSTWSPMEAGRGQATDMVNGYKWERITSRGLLQANDLAAKMPDKLREMQELFLVEAAKYQVFPLDNGHLERVLAPKPSYRWANRVHLYGQINRHAQWRRAKHPRQVLTIEAMSRYLPVVGKG